MWHKIEFFLKIHLKKYFCLYRGETERKQEQWKYIVDSPSFRLLAFLWKSLQAELNRETVEKAKWGWQWPRNLEHITDLELIYLDNCNLPSLYVLCHIYPERECKHCAFCNKRNTEMTVIASITPTFKNTKTKIETFVRSCTDVY